MMDPRKGDRIAIGSERAGVPERRGRILAVIRHPSGPAYRVRWDDGHESEIRPMPGMLRVLEAVASDH